MQILGFEGSWIKCHPRHLPDLSFRPSRAYRKAMFAPSVATHCLKRVQTAMRQHEKLMLWIALLPVTHRRRQQLRLDVDQWRNLLHRPRSACCHSRPLRRIALVRTARLRSVRSALSSTMLGIHWRDWNAFANFTKRASWNGSLGSKSARCIKLLDLWDMLLRNISIWEQHSMR